MPLSFCAVRSECTKRERERERERELDWKEWMRWCHNELERACFESALLGFVQSSCRERSSFTGNMLSFQHKNYHGKKQCYRESRDTRKRASQALFERHVSFSSFFLNFFFDKPKQTTDFWSWNKLLFFLLKWGSERENEGNSHWTQRQCVPTTVWLPMLFRTKFSAPTMLLTPRRFSNDLQVQQIKYCDTILEHFRMEYKKSVWVRWGAETSWTYR
jgi:hypothetical protein